MEPARTPKQLGNTIRDARRKLGWSQTVLGERTGLRQETVSRLETGNPAVRLGTVLAVLAVLDCELQVHARTQGAPVPLEDMY